MNGKSRGRLRESEASESDHIVSREHDSKATSYPDKYVLLCQNNCSSVHDKCALFKEIQYWKESCPYELQFTSSSQVLRWESPTISTTKSFTRKLQEFVIAQRTVSQWLVSTFQRWQRRWITTHPATRRWTILDYSENIVNFYELIFTNSPLLWLDDDDWQWPLPLPFHAQKITRPQFGDRFKRI